MRLLMFMATAAMGLVFLAMAMSGCGEKIEPAVGVETQLGNVVFGATEYQGEFAMYETDDIEWLCIMNTTEVVGGTLMDLRPWMRVKYWAATFSWGEDNMGFQHFIRFADKVEILP